MNDSGSSTDENEQERPLTPPPTRASREAMSQESPHRIPAFAFEEVSLHAVARDSEEILPLKTVVTKSDSASATRVTPWASEFGKAPTTSTIEESTTTKVRQRISREMIRETIQQRIAEGSLNRRVSTLEPSHIPSTVLRPHADKDLPPAPTDSIIMRKAHTTDAAPRQASDERPILRPRSHTQSAHEVLKASERDGVIGEPKSALDKLMQISGPSSARAVSTSSGIAGSILPEAKEDILRPAATPRTPSPKGEGSASREQAIIAKRRDKEARNTSSTPGASASTPRGRRRSLSVGDTADAPDVVSDLSRRVLQSADEMRQAKPFRSSVANPRLTLGIEEDGESILDAFREEAANIGAEVTSFRVPSDSHGSDVLFSEDIRFASGPRCMRHSQTRLVTARPVTSTLDARGSRSDDHLTWQVLAYAFGLD